MAKTQKKPKTTPTSKKSPVGKKPKSIGSKQSANKPKSKKTKKFTQQDPGYFEVTSNGAENSVSTLADPQPEANVPPAFIGYSDPVTYTEPEPQTWEQSAPVIDGTPLSEKELDQLLSIQEEDEFWLMRVLTAVKNRTVEFLSKIWNG